MANKKKLNALHLYLYYSRNLELVERKTFDGSKNKKK